MNQIKKIRNEMQLSLEDLSEMLNVKKEKLEIQENMDTVKDNKILLKLSNIPSDFPLRYKGNGNFRFIDLFAGVGGIRYPFQKMEGECVFSSEWNKHAKKTYFANYGKYPKGDITKINALDIPDHDILLGGFPCQAFSHAGKGEGFNDTRGTLFFEVQRILVNKRPKAFLLENVKRLISHDNGNTFKTILSILEGNYLPNENIEVLLNQDVLNALSQKLNYWVTYKVLRAADFGVPQNRERVFIVGFDKNYFGKDVVFEDFFKWPEKSGIETKVNDILEQEVVNNLEKDIYTISDNLFKGHIKRKQEHKKNGKGFGFSLYTGNEKYTNTLSARYYKDGSEILIDQTAIGKNPRFLTQRECARLQGFPENFIINAVSKNEMYKQFGNSVCMKVIDVIAENLVSAITKLEKNKKES